MTYEELAEAEDIRDTINHLKEMVNDLNIKDVNYISNKYTLYDVYRYLGKEHGSCLLSKLKEIFSLRIEQHQKKFDEL